MSKNLKKVSPILYRKILSTVEKIVMINNENEDNKVLNDIYMVVHPYVGTCNNVHEDWRLFTNEMEKKLKDCSI